MSESRSRLFWGLVMLVVGLLMLLRSLGLIGGMAGVVGTATFAVGAIVFLGIFFSNPDRWWAAIPGFAALGLALSSLLGRIAPAWESIWGGPIFLGSLGLGFLAVRVARAEHWWAAIPGGVLVTLSLVSLIDNLNTRLDTGGIFFLGLGLTFCVVALWGSPEGRMGWAFIPGGVLGAMGVLIFLQKVKLMGIVGALALIGAGAYLVLGPALRGGPGEGEPPAESRESG